MPKRKKRSLLFTGIQSKAGNLSSSQPAPALFVESLYRTINELLLDRFITVLCDGDLSALVKPGFLRPSDEELNLCWSGIFLEYLDASEDNQTRYKITLARDIEILRARLSQIESLILILRTMRHPEAVTMLQAKDNEDLLFPADDLDQYHADINMSWDRSREIKIDLDLKILEKSEIEESEKTAEEISLKSGIAPPKANRTMFLNILATIATYKKVAVIRTSEITVAEFCAMFREYLDHIKAVKAQLKKPFYNG